MSAQYRIDLPVGARVVLQYQAITSPTVVKSDVAATGTTAATVQYDVSLPVGTEIAVVPATAGFQIAPVVTTDGLGSALLDSSSSSPRRSTL